MQRRRPGRVLVVDLNLTVWDIRSGYKDPFGLCPATASVPVEHVGGTPCRSAPTRLPERTRGVFGGLATCRSWTSARRSA